MRTLFLSLTVLALLAAGVSAAEVGKERWIYCPTNLAVKENVDKLGELFARGQAAGYTHAYVTDSKMGHLHELPDSKVYFANVERLKELAKKHRIEIVPGVFPIGWSNDILWNDPNLAEGLPVEGALFVVQSGEARLQPDAELKFKGASLDNVKAWDWHDPTVVNEGGATEMPDLKGAVSRIVQTVAVKPFRQYHLAVKIRTKNFQGQPEIKVLAGERQLNHNDLGVKPTQDWTVHHTVFNSLDNEKVGIYLGCWGGSGSLGFDDATLEEVGLVNVLRRPGAPVTVKRDDDSTLLVEGKDYEPIVDPKLGNIAWHGDYDVYHEPTTIRLKAAVGTKPLPDGTRLRVSYYHPMIIYGGSVMISLSEPKTLDLLRDQAERVHKAFGAKGYAMQHDEIRILNWDKASRDRKLTSGQILAQNVRDCVKILDGVNPDGKIYVWSDMFDPNHNAVKGPYYLVRDTLEGSWEGLDPKVIVLNWNSEKAPASLKFFADRGNRQILAGYYDAPVDNIKPWKTEAQRQKDVLGIMYTTWANNYGELEAFAGAAK